MSRAIHMQTHLALNWTLQSDEYMAMFGFSSVISTSVEMQEH